MCLCLQKAAALAVWEEGVVIALSSHHLATLCGVGLGRMLCAIVGLAGGRRCGKGY
jgi:hypothetical protein